MLLGLAIAEGAARAGAAELVTHVLILFKLHLVLGLTIFLLFPFARLVHI